MQGSKSLELIEAGTVQLITEAGATHIFVCYIGKQTSTIKLLPKLKWLSGQSLSWEGHRYTNGLYYRGKTGAISKNTPGIEDNNGTFIG